MPFIGETSTLFLGFADDGFFGNVIDDSVIFNTGDANTVKWTAGTPTSQDIWTASFWVKRAEQFATRQNIFGVSSGSHNGHISWAANDTLELYNDDSVLTQQKFTSSVHRDPTAWTHWCISFSGAGPDEVVFEKDGVVQSQTTGTDDTISGGAINKSGADMVIGDWLHPSGVPADMILAQFSFIDGTVYSASDFGEFDANGNWGPKSDTDIRALSFGNNGIFLSNGTDIQAGTDTSGNSQSVTVTGLASSDVVSDSPTNSEDGTVGNFATLNPLNNKSGGTLSEGNLTVLTGVGQYGPIASTLAVPIDSTTIYRAQFTCDADSSGDFFMLGIITDYDVTNSTTTTELGHTANGYAYRGDNGQLRNSDAEVAYGNTYATGDVIDVFIGNGCLFFAKNGTLENGASESEVEAGTTTNAAASGLTGNYYFACSDFSVGQTVTVSANFGQKAWTNSYASISDVGVNSKTIADALAPPITDPSLHFTTVTVTGTGAEQAVTGVGFQPDMLWIKRTTAVEWAIYDSVRGATKEWNFDATNAESTVAQGVKSFDADGFTLGTDASVNALGGTYVVYCFKFDNSSGASNSDGTITTTVAVNADAKMSCGTFSGNATGGATIGHGLGVTPAVVIVKRLDSTGSPQVYHRDLGATKALEMDVAAVPVTTSTRWNDTAPSSTVITLGSSNATNASGTDNMVFYAFADVEGFFASGLYEGNSSADGPVVWAGHRPNVIWSKSIDNGESYYLSAGDAYLDYNPMDAFFIPDLDFAVQTSNAIDILATGFKMKTSNSVTNSSHTRVWFSLAKSPFTGTTSASQQSRAR